jgi:hypothetical protein
MAEKSEESVAPPQYSPPTRSSIFAATPGPSTRSKTIITSLSQCESSSKTFKKAGSLRYAGKTLQSINFALKITESTTYADITKVIYNRVKETWGVQVAGQPNVFYGLNLLVNGKGVYIKDEESWEPCRDLLLEGEGTLSFVFWDERKGGAEKGWEETVDNTKGRERDRERGRKIRDAGCKVQ